LGTGPEVAEAVRSVLADGQATYTYQEVVEADDGSTFHTVITPLAWPLILSTRMIITLYPDGSETEVLVATRSQWFILGDIFDFYGGYIRDMLSAISRNLGAAQPRRPGSRCRQGTSLSDPRTEVRSARTDHERALARYRTRLPFRNGTAADLILVVEPWADEVVLAPGEECEVVVIATDRNPALSVELSSYGLIVWVEEGGTTFEVWKGGKQFR
jgi:hypothetical protein